MFSTGGPGRGRRHWTITRHRNSITKENRVPARRLSMRKVTECLRLRFEVGLGQRSIARSCGIGLSTVHEYLERAAAAGIGWPLPEGWGEEELEAKLFGSQPVPVSKVRSQPDWKAMHEQLQQHRHLTLQPVMGGIPASPSRWISLQCRAGRPSARSVQGARRTW